MTSIFTTLSDGTSENRNLLFYGSYIGIKLKNSIKCNSDVWVAEYPSTFVVPIEKDEHEH